MNKKEKILTDFCYNLREKVKKNAIVIISDKDIDKIIQETLIEELRT